MHHLARPFTLTLILQGGFAEAHLRSISLCLVVFLSLSLRMVLQMGHGFRKVGGVVFVSRVGFLCESVLTLQRDPTPKETSDGFPDSP